MRGFTARLLATTAIPTLAAIALPNAAWAACTPAPSNGATITCDTPTAGDEVTTGFDGTGFTGMTVNVTSGSSVTNTNAAAAIQMDDGTVSIGQNAAVGGTTLIGNTVGANTDGINIVGAGSVTVQTSGTVTGVAGNGIAIGGAGNVTLLDGSTVTGANGAGITIGGDGTVNIGNNATVSATNGSAINVTGAATLTIGSATLSSTNANGINVGSGTVTSDAGLTVNGDSSVLTPIAGIRNPNGDVTTTNGSGPITVTLNSNPFGSRRDIYAGYTGGPAAVGIFGGTGSNTTVNLINNGNTLDVTATGNNNVAIGLEGSGDTRLQNLGAITVNNTGTGGIAVGMNGSTDGALNGGSGSITVNLNQGNVNQTAPNSNLGGNGTAIGMRIDNAGSITPPTSVNDNSGSISVTLSGSYGLGIGVAIDSSSQDMRNAGQIQVTDGGGNNSLIGIRGTPVSGTNNLLIWNTSTGDISLNAVGSTSAIGISAGGDASVLNDNTIGITANATTSSAIGVYLNSSGTFHNGSSGQISVTGGTTVVGARIISTVAQQAFINDGNIQVSGTNAIGVDMGIGTAVNNGQINVTGGIGVQINPSLGATQGPVFTNSATGSISASSTALLTLNTSGFGSPILDNAGQISSSDANLTAGAVVISHGDSITNTGQISATSTGSNAIVIGGTTQPAATSVISNAGAGQINAGLNAIVGTANAEQVDNMDTASINGNISLGGGNDSVSNAVGASISGNVDLGDGNNSITTDGSLNGDITAGAGNDSVANTGQIGGGGGSGNVTLGDGTNTLTNLGIASSIGGTVTFGSGDNTVTNEGSIQGNMSFGSGANTLNNSLVTATLGGNVTFGAGNDTLTNAGTINGTVALGNGTNTVTSSGVIGGDLTAGTGNDTITNSGQIAGNLIITGGNNTFTNATSTSSVGGNITLGAGNDAVANAGQIQGNVDGGGGANTFTAYDGSSVSGAITNFGTLVFQDGGTVLFGPTTSFQTTTISNAVNLTTNLSVANMTIASTGTLSGSANITGNVTNAGLFAPGDNTAVGSAANTMTITGNYVQSPTGRLSIDFQGGGSDTVNVSGTASLAGELDLNVLLSATPIPVGQTYQILTASNITGAFSTVKTSTTKFFTISYQQSATDIQVTLNRSSFVLPAFNSNQRAVAQALNALTTASAGTASQVVQTLTFTEKAQAAPVIDQLIPEVALNLATPALVTRRAFLGTISDNARSAGPNDEREGHWWSWASGFGQVGDVSGTSGSKYGFSTGGIVTGASYGLTDRTALGFVVGAATSSINVALQPGNNRHRSVDGAVYGAYIDGPVSATATASFGYDRFLTDRSINTGLGAVQASGRIGGYTTAGRLEGAYALDMGEFTLSPYVAAQMMNFHHGAYDETGAGTIGLRIAAEDVTSIRSTLGVAAEKAVDLGSMGDVTLHLGAAWEREFGDRILSSKAAFLAAPSQSFAITGITQDKDTANVVGGLTAALTGNVNVSLRYEGNLGATETVNRGRADLTWRW